MSRLVRKSNLAPEEPLELRLSRARDAAGWTRETLALRLKVAPEIIAAMEHGRWRQFPNATVAVGVLRNYAQAVGLDPNGLAQELRVLLEDGRDGRANKGGPKALPRPSHPAGALPQSLAVLGTGGAVMRIAVQRTVWGIEGRGNWRRGAFAGRRASRAPVPRQAHRIFAVCLLLLLLVLFADLVPEQDSSLALSRLLPEAPEAVLETPESKASFVRSSFGADDSLPYRSSRVNPYAPPNTSSVFATGTESTEATEGATATSGQSHRVLDSRQATDVRASENLEGRFNLVALEDGVVRLVTRTHGTLHVGTLYRGERIALNEADIPRLDTDNPAAFVLEFANDEPLHLGTALGLQDQAAPAPHKVWRGVPLLRSSLRKELHP